MVARFSQAEGSEVTKATKINAATLPNESSRAAVQSLALLLVSSGSEPFDVQAIRWGLSRLGNVASPDPLAVAGELVDAMLRVYDRDFAPRVARGSAIPICFGPCSPASPCSASFGNGIEIRHAPAAGLWLFDGRSFPADRIAAERAARRKATLCQLAGELGINRKGTGSEPSV